MTYCSIVPPYLIARLAAHPDARVASCAKTTLTEDALMRARPSTSAVRPSIAAEHSANPSVTRAISDTSGTTTLPGDLVRAEGAPATDDVAVTEAYDGLGQTWDLFWGAFDRDSLDGQGLQLDATVHYGRDYDNAFWNGSQMVFGDGDGVVFNRFTSSLDVIGHELTHGVTEKTAGLVYQDQPGALNESVSDVFGSLVKQKKLDQTAERADWLIGAELFTGAVQGVALRSMKAPGTAYDDDVLGKDPQPATMAGYVDTREDNGGVHINSGIPNHVFYLVATAIGGNAWVDAGQIWYDVLTGSGITAKTDFAGFAALTVTAAAARFGQDSTQTQAVRSAWTVAGIGVGGGDPSNGSVLTETPGPESGGVSTGKGGSGEVTLIRSGGFTGLRMERVVHPDQLGEDAARKWRGLLTSGLLREVAVEPTIADGYTYRVVAPQQDLDVTAGEHQLPEEIRALLNRTLKDLG